VLCAVIFASEKKEVVVADSSEGIDLQVDPVRDKNGDILLSEAGPTCLRKYLTYLCLRLMVV
jgi:hypothetical protein